MDEPTCSVDSCNRPVDSRGWCTPHYQRWQRTGDVNPAVPIRAPKPPGMVCTVDGCEKRAEKREWCGTHYWRWLNHGDPLYVRIRPTECSVDGCVKKPRSHGLCSMHSARFERHGDPMAVARIPARPVAELNYFQIHARLREARGSASGYQCVHCGRAAEQWAWIHDEDPCDFDSYVPMCRSCHKRYDPRPATGERIAWWRRWHEARDAFAGKRGDVA